MIPRFPGDGPKDLSKPLEQVKLLVDRQLDGARLDLAIAHFLHWRSRTSVLRLIKGGFIDLRGRCAGKPATRVRTGDVIVVRIPPPAEPIVVAPEDFELDILYQDRWMMAIDKPAGLAVHPAGRRVYGTLIHMLHQRYRRDADDGPAVVPRLMHRLDRETSGVIAIGLDEAFHGRVARQFETREVEKTYRAVVHGRPPADAGIVDFGIGPDSRSPIRLKLEARRDGSGQAALTHYRVERVRDPYSLVELRPKTGRTHQLRVHMAAVGCPLVGDKIYGLDEMIFLEQLAGDLSEASRAKLVLDRHALHASRLRFHHPEFDETKTIEAPLPADMAELVE